MAPAAHRPAAGWPRRSRPPRAGGGAGAGAGAARETLRRPRRLPLGSRRLRLRLRIWLRRRPRARPFPAPSALPPPPRVQATPAIPLPRRSARAARPQEGPQGQGPPPSPSLSRPPSVSLLGASRLPLSVQRLPSWPVTGPPAPHLVLPPLQVVGVGVEWKPPHTTPDGAQGSPHSSQNHPGPARLQL